MKYWTTNQNFYKLNVNEEILMFDIFYEVKLEQIYFK